MTVYICGNSHTYALLNGLENVELPQNCDITMFFLGNGKFETHPFSVRRNDEVIFSVDEYTRTITKHTGQSSISNRAIWGFCSVNHNARIYGNPMWRKFEPAAIAKPEAHPLSDSVLDEIIAQDTANLRHFFEQIKACGIDAFAISGPFPHEDHRSIEGGIRKEVVVYIDVAVRRMWRAWLSARKIPYVAPPEGAMTEYGFLKKKFSAETLKNGLKDPHHANAAYGAIMCRKIVRFLEKSGRLPDSSNVA